MNNCKTCAYWHNNNVIQDIYPDMDFTIPIEWKQCHSGEMAACNNMFLEDKKYEEYTLDNAVKYYGLDEDSRFRKDIKYINHTSELFGCIFHKPINHV